MMKLPEHVQRCIQILEAAGYRAYTVGGCVRDALLGLEPQDYDLCSDATPEQLQKVFSGYSLVLAGVKHGTVGVVIEKEVIEITTFRTEGNYTDNRHPDWVRFVTTIEDDLSRRDFTVNAMAFSPIHGFADPFGGKQDLVTKRLRAVGDPMKRFTEDALRILRGVRFSVKYGLTPENATQDAMFALAPLVKTLARERVFEELCKLLPLMDVRAMLRFAPVLTEAIPELAPLQGFDQKNPHHIYDIYTHTAHVVANTPESLVLRWAALLHDVGKPVTFYIDEVGCGHFPSHAKHSAEMANGILMRLKAPTALRNQVVDLIARHMTPLEPDRRILRRRLNQYGVEGTLAQLQLQEADCIGTGTRENLEEFRQIHTFLQALLAEDACIGLKDLAVNGKDLIALGYAPGKPIGFCLNKLLEMVTDELLPNKKDALLAEARQLLQEDRKGH